MIGLILSPLGRWLAYTAAILVVLAGIYAKGRSDGKEACERDRQARIDSVLNYERERAERDGARIAELSRQVADLEKEFEARTDDGCKLNKKDAQRLDAIR